MNNTLKMLKDKYLDNERKLSNLCKEYEDDNGMWAHVDRHRLEYLTGMNAGLLIAMTLLQEALE